MTYLSAALVLLGLLTISNLLLTIGIVRRLREHTAQLAGLDNAEIGDIALPVGSAVAEFASQTTDGVDISLSSLPARALVSFFSPSCVACKKRLPEFVGYAASNSADRNSLLAVVAGPADESADLIEQLRPVALVVSEPEQGPVQRAFGVTGYPAFVALTNGRVMTSSYLLEPAVEASAQPSTTS